MVAAIILTFSRHINCELFHPFQNQDGENDEAISLATVRRLIWANTINRKLGRQSESPTLNRFEVQIFKEIRREGEK